MNIFLFWYYEEHILVACGDEASDWHQLEMSSMTQVCVIFILRILSSSGGLPTALIIAYNVCGSIGPH